MKYAWDVHSGFQFQSLPSMSFTYAGHRIESPVVGLGSSYCNGFTPGILLPDEAWRIDLIVVARTGQSAQHLVACLDMFLTSLWPRG